ncbi:hypothetical protein L916_10282, partial [Phytophthora nicotianae]
FDEDWTADSLYVEHVLANRYRRGRFVLPEVIPLVRLPVMAAVTHELLTGPPAKRQCLADAHGSSGSNVVVEQSPVGVGEPTLELSSSSPVRMPLAYAQLSPWGAPQQQDECVEHEQELLEENGDLRLVWVCLTATQPRFGNCLNLFKCRLQ